MNNKLIIIIIRVLAAKIDKEKTQEMNMCRSVNLKIRVN